MPSSQRELMVLMKTGRLRFAATRKLLSVAIRVQIANVGDEADNLPPLIGTLLKKNGKM